jgi:2-polyprenyl-3-methyl-5-hydroxy-6-metoxy-1,4-benzoquinol methylase
MKYDTALDLETRNSLSIIISRIKPNSSVLEFGPANGRMTKYLKEALNCKVYAVELNQEAANDAQKFCEKIIVGNIEEYAWLNEYNNIKFDHIVFADVLEHLYCPNKVLKKSMGLLADDGGILMSVPNISHNSILIELLNDKFTYRSLGLLDNTHIRFFTKNTLEQLVRDCGLTVAYESASYVHPMQTEFKYSYDDVEEHVAELLANRRFGEAYQFIFEAKTTVVETVVDFRKEEQISLYYDTGLGLNEKEKATSRFSFEHDKEKTISFNGVDKRIKLIRIDLPKQPLVIKLKSFKINGQNYLKSVRHNGSLLDNSAILFSNFHPQLRLSFLHSKTIENISIEYEFINKINSWKDQEINRLTKLVDSMRIKTKIKKLFGLNR